MTKKTAFQITITELKKYRNIFENKKCCIFLRNALGTLIIFKEKYHKG